MRNYYRNRSTKNQGYTLRLVHDVQNIIVKRQSVSFQVLNQQILRDNSLGDLKNTITSIDRPSDMRDCYWENVLITLKRLTHSSGYPTPVTLSTNGWDFGIEYQLLEGEDHPALELFSEKVDNLQSFLR